MCELTTVITLGAVNESLWLAFLVGLFTLLANATYSIGNDLRLQGQNNAIKTTHTWVSCSHGQWSSSTNISCLEKKQRGHFLLINEGTTWIICWLVYTLKTQTTSPGIKAAVQLSLMTLYKEIKIYLRVQIQERCMVSNRRGIWNLWQMYFHSGGRRMTLRILQCFLL